MKKLTLVLAASTLSLSSFASTRILYQQNFETAPDAASTGWTYGGGSMTIASDEWGKFLELSLGQNNGRSGQVTWGQDIFLNGEGVSILEDGTYNLAFDFCVKTPSNNQYNSGITVFTNHEPIANQTYRTPWSPAGAWSNFLIDLNQSNTTADTDMSMAVNAPLVETTGEDDAVTYSLDLSAGKTVVSGTWYTVSLTVDVESRNVDYTIVSITGDEFDSGTYEVPETDVNGEAISMYAEGIFAMTARYQTTMLFDNIKITCETSEDFANAPTIALTKIGETADEQLDLNMRGYTISFLEGETLHVMGPDGNTVETEFDDCDGAYRYWTSTSGVIKAWTTSGDAKSEEVEVVADCVPCVLPAVDAVISSVNAGFGKTYTLNVSNAEVPMRPDIFINYEFVGTSGKTLTGENLVTGATVAVEEEGVLTVTSSAYGYQATTVTVKNDIEFVEKKVYDFARMTRDELTKAGFTDWVVLNSGVTSGFNNWTARKRLFYYDKATESTDADGNLVYENAYPFGYIDDANTTNVINYSSIGNEEGDKGLNVEGYELFEGIRVFDNHNVTVLERIGMCNNSTKGGNNKNAVILNLDATDFVVCNNINNYGGNSCHPVVATADEYYAQLKGEDFVYSVAEVGVLDEETGKYSVTHPVYRIDTALTKVTVYANKNAGAGINDVITDAVENNDPYYYSIDGLRTLEPTHTGIYIHQGKKVYIVK